MNYYDITDVHALIFFGVLLAFSGLVLIITGIRGHIARTRKFVKDSEHKQTRGKSQ